VGGVSFILTLNRHVYIMKRTGIRLLIGGIVRHFWSPMHVLHPSIQPKKRKSWNFWNYASINASNKTTTGLISRDLLEWKFSQTRPARRRNQILSTRRAPKVVLHPSLSTTRNWSTRLQSNVLRWQHMLRPLGLREFFVCIWVHIGTLRLSVCGYITYIHIEITCVDIYVHMRTEITCVCIYSHICALRLRVCRYLHVYTLRLRVCVHIYIYPHWDYACVYVFTYMHTGITCLCIFTYAQWDYLCVRTFTCMRTAITCMCTCLHICTLRLRVCVYIYMYDTEITCVCIYLHVCTLRLRVCV